MGGRSTEDFDSFIIDMQIANGSTKKISGGDKAKMPRGWFIPEGKPSADFFFQLE